MRKVLACGALVLVTACTGTSGPAFLDADELPPAIYGEQERPTLEMREVRSVAYFVHPEQLRLIAIPRVAETDLVMHEWVLTELLAFRQLEDQVFRTAIPLSSELLRIGLVDGVAEVNLSSAFELPDSSEVLKLRLAQVVWTLTELPDVDAVRFLIHGAHEPVIDQDGVAHRVVSRARYAAYAPESAGSLVEDCTVVETLEGCEEEESP